MKKRSMIKKIEEGKRCQTNLEVARIYWGLKAEISKNFVEQRERTQAVKLQSFLRQIKYIQHNGGIKNINYTSFPFSKFWENAEQLALMQKLQTIKTTQGKSVLENIHLINAPSDSHALGRELEIGMAQVVKSMEVVATGKTYKEVKPKIVGGLHTQISDLDEIVDEVVKDQFINLYQTTQEQLKESQNLIPKKAEYKYIPSVQGKIDVMGLTADLEIKSNLSDMEKDIVEALTNATFTAKNYVNTFQLKFGRTNPFRVYATVTQGSNAEKIKGFLALEQCIKTHKACSTASYFYRIRAIYEITGARMQYTKKTLAKLESAVIQMLNGKPAKFLLWNNPGGQIYVIPTGSIIQDIVDQIYNDIQPKNANDVFYGPIVVQQTNLAKIALDESQF